MIIFLSKIITENNPIIILQSKNSYWSIYLELSRISLSSKSLLKELCILLISFPTLISSTINTVKFSVSKI